LVLSLEDYRLIVSFVFQYDTLDFDALICSCRNLFIVDIYFHTTAILGKQGFFLNPHWF